MLLEAVCSACAVVFLILSSCSGEIIPLKLSQQTHRHRREASHISDNLHGQSGEGYYIELDIGTPPQRLNALVDTGSSNFALAASPNNQIQTYFHKNESSTFEDQGVSVYVPYTQGEWTGGLGSDIVSLPSLQNVSVRADIAFISQSSDFFLNTSNWQGIIGFAYEEIARPNGDVVPFFDHLVKDGHVRNIFSVQLCGARALPNSPSVNSSFSSMNGTMLLGGISSSLYTGDIFYTPIHKEWYYEIVITDVLVNNASLGMDCKEYNYDKTIVDTGTTNLRFPDKVFQEVVAQIKGNLIATNLLPSELFWSGVEIECWQDLAVPYNVFPTVGVSVLIDNSTYFRLTLLPQQYLRPVQDPSDPSLSGYCFKFGIATSSSGTVLGAVLMEGYYVVFDRVQKRIGFAETTCPPRHPSTSSEDTKISGAFHHSGGDLLQCAYVKPSQDGGRLMVVAYVMAAVCVVCVLPLVVLLVQYQIRKCRGHVPPSEAASDTGSLINR